MGGEAMPVGHEKITGICILHTHIVAHGAKIIAQVKKTGGPDTTQYNLFFHAAKIRGIS
jgi:hypothetical protein